MRVVYVTHSSPPKCDGVTTRYVHTWQTALDLREDLEIFVYSTCYEPGALAGVEHVMHPRLHWRPFPAFNLASFGARPGNVFRLDAMIGIFRDSPDLVHVIGPDLVVLPIAILAAVASVPCVCSYHTDIDAVLESYGLPRILRTPLLWFEWGMWACERIFVTGAPTGHKLKRKYGLATCLWPVGLAVEHLRPENYSQAVRDELTFGLRDQPLLLSASRLAKDKRVEFVVRAFRAWGKGVLAILGEGPLAEQLTALHGVENRIFCPGQAWSGRRLSQAFASADIFVSASKMETLGFSVLEAMSSGTCVCIADRGGHLTTCQNGENGVLFLADDSNHLVECLESIWTSQGPGTHDETKLVAGPICRTARQRCVERYSWKRATEMVLGVYDDVLADRTRSADGISRSTQFLSVWIAVALIAISVAMLLTGWTIPSLLDGAAGLAQAILLGYLYWGNIINFGKLSTWLQLTHCLDVFGHPLVPGAVNAIRPVFLCAAFFVAVASNAIIVVAPHVLVRRESGQTTGLVGSTVGHVIVHLLPLTRAVRALPLSAYEWGVGTFLLGFLLILYAKFTAVNLAYALIRPTQLVVALVVTFAGIAATVSLAVLLHQISLVTIYIINV